MDRIAYIVNLLCSGKRIVMVERARRLETLHDHDHDSMSAMSSSTSIAPTHDPYPATLSTTSVLPCGLHSAHARREDCDAGVPVPWAHQSLPLIGQDAEDRARRRVR